MFFPQHGLTDGQMAGAKRAAQIMSNMRMPVTREAARREWLKAAFALARDGVIAWPDPELNQ